MTRFPAALLPLTLLLAACTSTAPAPSAATAEGPHGISVTEEATILRLEDRREYDAVTARTWAAHGNPTHRSRIALALGRIGGATFEDTNGNGIKDRGELQAGVSILTGMATDRDSSVRRTVAFALGEIGDPAAVETLLLLARDTEDARVASEAIEALSKMAGDVPFARYAEFTGESFPEGVRAHAVQYLFRFAGEEPAVAAAALLDSPIEAIRREAAYALGRKAHPPAAARLQLLLTDRDTLTRSYAARALGLIADPAAIAPLLGALGDAHPWVRTNAARSLAQIFTRRPETIGSIDLAREVSSVMALAADPDPGTRVTAIELMGHYAPRVTAIRERLVTTAASGTGTYRETAVLTLARHLGASSPDVVRSLVQTDQPWLKVRALEGAAATPLGAELREKLATDPSPHVRGVAISSIPQAQRERERARIERALSDDDPLVRSAAIDAYASLPIDPATKLATLREQESRARTEDNNDARLSAVRAIAALDLPERESFLRSLAAETDPVVRRTAAELLAEKLTLPRPQFAPLAVERPLSWYEETVRWSRDRHTAQIKLGRGTIEVFLLSQDAPITARNFADLAKRGYFDGTTFMRVVPNFVIQGGDPRNDQSGGPGYSIRDEINMQRYTRGAVGMALSGPDTGGSQFFITHSPQPHLDGGYTVFGRVTSGMTGVVDQVERGDRVETITIISTPAEVNLDSAARTPPPLEIGTTTAARMLATIPEYEKRRDEYTPDRDAIEVLAMTVQPEDRVEVYLGTWCSDSLREVPRFLKILDALQAQGVTLPASYVGVDRSKKEPAALLAGKNIDLVATFIYYRGDSELGRIVETPNGLLEDHLLLIAAKR